MVPVVGILMGTIKKRGINKMERKKKNINERICAILTHFILLTKPLIPDGQKPKQCVYFKIYMT